MKELVEALDDEFQGVFKAAKNELNIKTYGALTKSVLTKIMDINRRRPGDLHKTTEFRKLTNFRNLMKV